jgi:hypothetical protein
MRSHSHKLATLVILSVAKDLTQASLITLGKQRDTNSVGEVPHFVRDDARPMRRGVLLTRCT